MQTQTYYTTQYSSPLGRMTLASDGGRLVGLWFEGQKYFLKTLPKEVLADDGIPVFRKTKEWLTRYFEGEKPKISDLALAPSGSEFRQAVWKILCEIPYGGVMTYKEIAERIASERGLDRMSAQAVGGAVGHNPISVIIPCHRVIGSDRSLTGYAGGLSIKEALLRHEGVLLNQCSVKEKKSWISFKS